MQEWGEPVHYILILANFWTKVGLKSRLEFPVFEKILLLFVEYPFNFHKKFNNRDV
jgi:hypothetical protein